MSPSHHKSKTGKSKQQEKRAAKKAAVLGSDRQKKSPWLPILIVLVVLGIGGTYFLKSPAVKGPSVQESNTTHTSQTQVTYEASSFEDGAARHFAHTTDDGITIKYFVLKSADGIIRAAFDACDVCWPAGLGYYQEADKMVCRNCGRKFASIMVNEVKGGCNPAPLNRRVENGKVVIEIADILTGRQYFDFARKG